MLGKLHASLKDAYQLRRLGRKYHRWFRRWLETHPGGTYAEYYVEHARRRVDAGRSHKTLGITTVNQEMARARAQRVLVDFKRAGCMPHHVVLDYGCGSLWIGEALMEYLEPGNYIGLDVSDVFYAEGLTRLAPDFVASRKPMLRVIGEEALQEVRARKPDFIASIAVMQHVPPDDLSGYFARVTSLATPGTRIEISGGAGLFSKCLQRRKWQHGRRAIRAALAPLGYVAEYSPDRRIMLDRPGFSLVRC